MQRPITCPEIFCSLLINGGFAFMYWYFLFKVENDNSCWATQYTSDGTYFDPGDGVDVKKNFDVVLSMYAIL